MSKRGYEGVHISVAKKNIPAQKTYSNFGFKNKGEADMFNNSFYLYEKSLDKTDK